jgi:NAD(P)-dependent dehydrogenase (short-subunit alcohol dehydrogenase family)
MPGRLSARVCDLGLPGLDRPGDRHLRTDRLYNLAGASYFNWLEDVNDEEWDGARRKEVDLIFYLTRAAWRHLKSSGGVILNMASLNASLSFKILPSPSHTTNKAGIMGMTRQLAMEGREHGTRADSISPGLVPTERLLNE